MASLVHQSWQRVKRRPRLYRALLPLARAAAQAVESARHCAEIAAAPVHFGLPWLHAAPGIGKAPQTHADGTRTVVMLVVSDLAIDPRVRREARALADAGWHVLILCPLPACAPPDLVLDWGPRIAIRWLPESAGRFAYRFPSVLGSALLKSALAERPFAFHAHDLATTLIVLTAAHRTGAHAVCDFHEWMSENATFDRRKSRFRAHAPRVAAVYRQIERLAVRRASATITVGEAIADQLDSLGGSGRRVHVVRNMPAPGTPPTRTYPSLRDTLAIPAGQTLVLYQGGIGPSRNLEPVISALALAPNVALAIRGPAIAHYRDAYRAVAEAAGGGAADRLHFLDAVPQTDVVAAANGADVGLYTVADVCKSFTLAMPNKVFEYLHAGLPVLAADFPEVRGVVEAHGVGLLFNSTDPAAIAEAMSRLADEPHLAESFAARAALALEALDATREWQRIVEIYARLSPGDTGAPPPGLAPVGRAPMGLAEHPTQGIAP